jgi:hypothetical protein
MTTDQCCRDTMVAGILQLVVITPDDASALLIDAIAGDADAMRLFNAIGDTQAKVVSAPKRSPILCASCPTPLLHSRYSLAVAFPSCDTPGLGLGMAVCAICATTPAAIAAKALFALRVIWPDLRPIEIAHPEGGTA